MMPRTTPDVIAHLRPLLRAMTRSVAFVLGLLALMITGASAQSAVVPAQADAVARKVDRAIVTRGDVRIEVLRQGAGPLVVLLPSLGRGAEDFDEIAVRLAGAGFRVLRPQPRGIGASHGPLTGITLHDYANDVAAVIEDAHGGPALVVGHAFGNRVARLLATVRPDLVRAVALVAANVGRNPSPPKVREAIKASANLSLPDEARLAALQFAFFAPGHDAHAWLEGWHPDVLAAERIAGDKTPRTEDYAAGHAPVLYLQPDHDPLGHVEDARAYKRALGDRVTVVVIQQASHAVVTEQPDAVAQELIKYARALPPLKK
jgi:pimeloyl-ACP methyl ester carboxylesterase